MKTNSSQVNNFTEDEYFVKMSDSSMANSLRLGRKGFIIGALLSAIPLQNYLESKHILEIAGQSIFKYALPAGVTAAILGGTIGVLDDVRGKECGISNGAIGGFIAGAFIGSKSHNPWRSFQVGASMALAATILRFFMLGGFGNNYKELQLDNLNKTIYLGDYKHLIPKS